MTNAERQAAWRKRQADERKHMEQVIAWANNSLYGSYGLFMSLNGGAPDEHHLDRPIEDLKLRANQQWRRAETMQTALREIASKTDGKTGPVAVAINKLALEALGAKQ